jgi:hypothetical protein
VLFLRRLLVSVDDGRWRQRQCQLERDSEQGQRQLEHVLDRGCWQLALLDGSKRQQRGRILQLFFGGRKRELNGLVGLQRYQLHAVVDRGQQRGFVFGFGEHRHRILVDGR